jgi:hypothetical protein
MMVGNIGWRLFLWGNETTDEKYWCEIYEQEKRRQERAI